MHLRTKLKRFCSRSNPSRVAGLLGALLTASFLHGPGAEAATPEWRQRALFGEHGPARNELREPVAVALLDDGRVAVLESDRGSLVVFDDRGRYQRTLEGPGGVGGSDLRHPEGLDVDPEENLWVADTGNHRLLVLKPDGTLVATYGSLGSSEGRLREPRDVTFDRAGRAYVADTGNERIQVLRASNGAVVDSWSSRTGGRRGHLTRPVALAYSGRDSGGIWVLNRDAGRRLEFFDLEGNWEASLDVPAAVQGEVDLADVVVDPGLYRMFLADRAGGGYWFWIAGGGCAGWWRLRTEPCSPEGWRCLEAWICTWLMVPAAAWCSFPSAKRAGQNRL